MPTFSCGRDVCRCCAPDFDYNIFVQLSGTKTFTLLPPSAARGFCLHPYHHARWRQGQVTHLNLNLNGSAGSGSTSCPQPVNAADALVVTLTDGEALFLPPLWFHAVETTQVTLTAGCVKRACVVCVIAHVWRCDCLCDRVGRCVFVCSDPALGGTERVE